ncbi:ECF transporter S component [Faecalimonas sp.]
MNNTAIGNKPHTQVKGMVQVALFAALIVIMAFTPFLGYIPLGFTRATIIHIPVIIGALILGPQKGAILGFVFGLTSLINNTMNPTVTSFVFSPFYSLGEIYGGIGSIIICFLPRILVGIVPYYVYQFMMKITKKWKSSMIFSLGISGIIGSLVNTLLVMNLIFVFFRKAYAMANNVSAKAVYGFILSIIGINGVPEAIVAGVIVTFVGRVLLKSKSVVG